MYDVRAPLEIFCNLVNCVEFALGADLTSEFIRVIQIGRNELTE